MAHIRVLAYVHCSHYFKAGELLIGLSQLHKGSGLRISNLQGAAEEVPLLTGIPKPSFLNPKP